MESTCNNVFGGYTSKYFGKAERDSAHTKDENAFLYSIRSTDISPQIFHVKKEDDAVFYACDYLCNFGNGGWDIWVQSKCNLQNRNVGTFGESFDMKKRILIGNTSSFANLFVMKELEIFQL